MFLKWILKIVDFGVLRLTSQKQRKAENQILVVGSVNELYLYLYKTFPVLEQADFNMFF